MKNKLFVCLIILIFSTFVYGEFAILQIKERVKQSNLIVVGTLQDVSETETDKLRISKGTLVIEKVILGSFKNSQGQILKLGEKVQVEWTNSKMFACQFGFSENEKEIWFLNVDEGGNIQPLSPSTSASLSDLTEVKENLRKKDKNNAVKILNTLNDNDKVPQLSLPKATSEETVKCLYSINAKQNQYSPFSAFLVILASLSLYYLLYRSRLKIR